MSISNRLKIPYNYLKKYPQDIQADSLNYWIKHEKNSELFFRFDDNIFGEDDALDCALLEEIKKAR